MRPIWADGVQRADRRDGEAAGPSRSPDVFNVT